MSEGLKFELKRKEVPVVLVDETGTEQTYTLREMSGTTRDGYLNSLGARVRQGKGGQAAGFKDFNNFQADLLTRCLYGPDGKTVGTALVQNWPASVQSALFKEAQRLNGLDEEAQDRAKNS